MKSSKQKLILIGGGGHCKSCIDVIEKEGRFQISGIVDVPEKYGEKAKKENDKRSRKRDRMEGINKNY